MIMIIKIFLVYSSIISGFLVYSSIINGFIRDRQSFAAGMPTSDESNRGLNAPDLPTNSTLESTAATPAKRKNLATSDGNSPGKPRGFTVSPRSKKLRSPGGRGQIHWVSVVYSIEKKKEDLGTQPGTKEVRTPAPSSQRRLNFTGSAPSSSLVFLREDGQPDPTAPGDTHHAGGVLSRVLLVLAAVIAVINFQKMAQAHRQRADYKKRFLVSYRKKGTRAPALRFVLLLRFERANFRRTKGATPPR